MNGIFGDNVPNDLKCISSRFDQRTMTSQQRCVAFNLASLTNKDVIHTCFRLDQ